MPPKRTRKRPPRGAASSSQAAIPPSQAPSTELQPSSNGLIWYAMGVPASEELAELGNEIISQSDSATKMLLGANMRPTTWEEADAYLKEEVKKPQGERDLRREMCYFLIVQIDGPGEVLLKMDETKLIMKARSGQGMVYPSIDCPPWLFDPSQGKSRGVQLIDAATGEERKAVTLITYVTNTTGEDIKLSEEAMANAKGVDGLPFT